MKKKDLVKKLDKVFSEYIRLRDCSDDGIGFCISCGRPIRIGTSDCQCGHYHSRRHYNTRWNEKNCNAQCRSCNLYNQGNIHGYTRGLIKKYGEGVIEELEVASALSKKYSDFELNELIKIYTNKVKELKNQCK